MRNFLLKHWSLTPVWQPAARGAPFCSGCVRMGLGKNLIKLLATVYLQTPKLQSIHAKGICGAIAAGKSVGRADLIVTFLWGTGRLNPPCPHTVPAWDLSMILRGPQRPPVQTAFDGQVGAPFAQDRPPVGSAIAQVSRILASALCGCFLP